MSIPLSPANRPGYPRRSRRVARAIVAVALVALILTLALVLITRPWVANAAGYALPGAGGLPDHFAYQGVAYSAPQDCAGAHSCATEATARWSQSKLASQGLWPLKQVASLPTLFGAARPILEPIHDPSMLGAGTPYASDLHPFLLFILSGSQTYAVYMRPGGP